MYNPDMHNMTAYAHLARTALGSVPAARAQVRGGPRNSRLKGVFSFYAAGNGSLVTGEVNGLPKTHTGIYAVHIHDGASCTGNAEDPFAASGQHFNPANRPHPLHVGDLLPLFGNDGFAVYSFYTDRFLPGDVVGHTVIIHSDPDDFRSQPSGNSGGKIACGVIEKTR